MTTVAWKDNYIAGDTLIVTGNTKIGTVIKVGKVKQVLYGVCGSAGLMGQFMSWMRAGMQGSPPDMGSYEGRAGHGIIILGDNVISVCPGGLHHVRAKFFAIGSGCELAMGAMAAGKSAAQAVKIASQIDTVTGSEITVLRRDA